MPNLTTFLKEVREEMSKVTWPSKEQTLQLTVLVVVISLIVGIYVGGLDLVFTSLMDKLIR